MPAGRKSRKTIEPKSLAMQYDDDVDETSEEEEDLVAEERTTATTPKKRGRKRKLPNEKISSSPKTIASPKGIASPKRIASPVRMASPKRIGSRKKIMSPQKIGSPKKIDGILSPKHEKSIELPKKRGRKKKDEHRTIPFSRTSKRAKTIFEFYLLRGTTKTSHRFGLSPNYVQVLVHKYRKHFNDDRHRPRGVSLPLEKKRKIYEYYLANGYEKTAKQFNYPKVFVYNLVRYYKSKINAKK